MCGSEGRGRLVIEATICHVFRGEKLLLKKATRGISVGKWNAPGGKLDPGESPEACAVREVLEETGLVVSDLFYHGTLAFMMGGANAVYMRGHLFSTRKATGRARSSEEGQVRWFELDSLPVAEMWEDDQFWMPLMLMGARFDAIFAYDRENLHVVEFSIKSRRP
ncbi:MAG: 8-oxo-dGTP diphosphatase [Nitrososphaerota archaeon]|nr:8-oxo-dGTP diphosphatase [Nitrososphaerota archaeon]MDG6966122.1 8-oxo-dGTP diphosphatase [Nitrososphaerota archaeon]MDG6977557.1 8-oxo-dGTP diphosphatase [Nitrososphaerota archaeon]MDG6981459.1 8-oxo-dGTP diphosphatase [Nitrososphaerota archaeon]